MFIPLVCGIEERKCEDGIVTQGQMLELGL